MSNAPATHDLEAVTDEGLKSSRPPDAEKFVRSIAIVSGKGGSGKTMIVATIARAFDRILPGGITIVDTDIGTGGLSYYFAINYAQGLGTGLSELFLALRNGNQFSDGGIQDQLSSIVRPLLDFEGAGFQGSRFVSVGDLRKLQNEGGLNVNEESIVSCLNEIHSYRGGVLLVDCRGGVDAESIAVCKFVDDIVIVAETDPASFQATQFLSNVLSDKGMTDKIRGFVVNRAFRSPSDTIHKGVQAFRGQYLGSVPFDLAAIEGFHEGTLPQEDGVFDTHVRFAFARAYPFLPGPRGRVWTFSDYGSHAVGDRDANIGGLALTAAGLSCIVASFITSDFGMTFWKMFDTKSSGLLLAGALFSLLASIGPARRGAGRLLTFYVSSILSLWTRFAG